MSMTPQDFNDKDEQAAWELIGRQKSIEPSFGFAQRTVRRLHEAPARRFWELPVVRWATALSLLMIVAGGLTYRHVARQRSADLALVPQETLEDYDVIAALDQLDGGGKL